MARILALMVIATGLAACGAEGEPLTPNASAGVSVGTEGTDVNASVGASNGSFGFRIGL